MIYLKFKINLLLSLNIHLLKHHLAHFLKTNQRISSGNTQHSKSLTQLNLKRITTKDLVSLKANLFKTLNG